jgi:hypothetical protein
MGNVIVLTVIALTLLFVLCETSESIGERRATEDICRANPELSYWRCEPYRKAD